jgi:hypothetical protein
VAECPIINEKRKQLIDTFKSPKIVIISANEELFKMSKKRTADPAKDGRNGMSGGEIVDSKKAYHSYKENIRSLLSQGHIVVLVFSIPQPDIDPMPIYFHALLRHKFDGSSQVEQRYINYDAYAQSKEIDDKLEFPDHPNLIKVYPKEVLCANKDHQCLLISPQGSIYNNFHLSSVGADLVMHEALSQLEKRGYIVKAPQTRQ